MPRFVELPPDYDARRFNIPHYDPRPLYRGIVFGLAIEIAVAVLAITIWDWA